VKSLNDSVELVRIRAALSLGRVGDKDAAPYLVATLAAPSEKIDVKRAAAKSLREITGESIDSVDPAAWKPVLDKLEFRQELTRRSSSHHRGGVPVDDDPDPSAHFAFGAGGDDRVEFEIVLRAHEKVEAVGSLKQRDRAGGGAEHGETAFLRPGQGVDLGP
jgi:hypothetical protein